MSREGLPPCVRMAVFNERAVMLIDREGCQGDHGLGVRFGVRLGDIDHWAESVTHPGPKLPWVPIATLTDDPEEAEAAFERGERWVRTGELDE